MRYMKVGFLLMALLVLTAHQAQAHGTHSTSGTLTPAVKPTDWWQIFLPEADAAAQITVSEQDGYRYFKTDSLPDHSTGQFPNRSNPNTIQSHERSYRIKLKPTKQGELMQAGHNLFGIALNGVVFDSQTAEYWNNNRSWNIEAITGNRNLGIDSSNAHVQPDGTYHYHGIPNGLWQKGPYKDKPVLLGYAADGFPIYGPFGYQDPQNASSPLVELKTSWQTKPGNRTGGPGGRYDGTYTADWEYAAGLGDLDQCNGRNGVTPEYPDGTYHYVITKAFPHIARCWVGFPDASFRKQFGPSGGGGGPRLGGSGPQGGPQRPQGGSSRQGGMGGPPGGGQGGPMGGPPPEALDVCRNAQQGADCEFEGHRGPVQGNCITIHTGDMACAPAHMQRMGGGPGQGPGGPGNGPGNGPGHRPGQ